MHDDGLFDEEIAATYDDEGGISAPEVVDPAVNLLAELAGGGRVLEFAIGTGRLALPLARKGVQVEGIELSRAMVSRLRAKEGGAEIPVVIGDMVTTRVERRFSLVYLAFNTINNLTSQEAQVACFLNAAAHLETGGYFLIEVGVPPLQRLPLGEALLAFDRSETHWGIDEYDVVNQNFSSHHIWFRDGSYRHFSVPFRYAWPAEFDLMARLAGLKLKDRWGGWKKEPFTKVSDRHVSVWQKIANREHAQGPGP
ncbi:probable methyltransferase protein (plasmid) [Rhizobium etli CIAT 652]|uniref:Probable methyltransferase protein n=1 Tax=Rhizobium etli (strain CIAT 652) TaxID=491916 RepID=B3Q4R1_RHIE6|nr:class I SAM-dependent methyltransferase [Rhizobium phaseoli]ACE94192.1 probable methyltransferase protein [Rhizobium etli CIAT 652]PDS30257.1 class I SAM-dependent methyltransferase [Rhizobium phaseoli]